MDGDALAMWKSSASPSLRAARTSTMSGEEKRRRPAPSATPWDGAGDGELSPAACPRCGSPAIEGNGRDANGVRRWRCLSCGRAFNPATGTVFDGRKLPVADWTEFLLEVFSYGSLAGAARSGRSTGSPSCSRCWRGCRRAPSWPAGWRSTR